MGKNRHKNSDKRISTVLLNELKEQLISIGLSVKPSYLWEICVGDCDQVLHVCHQFNIDLSDFNIIQINDNIFIVNIECLLKHLNHVLSESFNQLIDVSPDLQFPKLLNCDEMKTKKNFLKLLLNELELHSKDKKYKIECLSDEYIDMCFISGAVLGYPVIYCNNNIENGNCLSCQPLCAYSIKRFSQNQSFPPIYSFSLPEMYRKLFYSNINLWFITINNLCNNNLVLREDLITMPYVLT